MTQSSEVYIMLFHNDTLVCQSHYWKRFDSAVRRAAQVGDPITRVHRAGTSVVHTFQHLVHRSWGQGGKSKGERREERGTYSYICMLNMLTLKIKLKSFIHVYPVYKQGYMFVIDLYSFLGFLKWNLPFPIVIFFDPTSSFNRMYTRCPQSKKSVIFFLLRLNRLTDS